MSGDLSVALKPHGPQTVGKDRVNPTPLVRSGGAVLRPTRNADPDSGSSIFTGNRGQSEIGIVRLARKNRDLAGELIGRAVHWMVVDEWIHVLVVGPDL